MVFIVSLLPSSLKISAKNPNKDSNLPRKLPSNEAKHFTLESRKKAPNSTEIEEKIFLPDQYGGFSSPRQKRRGTWNVEKTMTKLS
jgi:hypothetical protein